MQTICGCGALAPSDGGCPICGTAFGGRSSRAEYAAEPRRRRHRPRRWYRRPIVIATLATLLVLGSAAGVFLIRAGSAVVALQTISTPPPVLSADVLGGHPETQIDTTIAQTNVRNANDGGDDRGGWWDRARDVAGGAADATKGVAVAAGVADEPEPESMNILLMGVDARPGEAIDSEVRPDALAVLHLDAATGDCRLLAIPRDTRVELPGYGLTKVNHALAVGGIPYQRQVVEQFLGISIDRYGLIDFSGVEQLVDAVGGVSVVVSETFTLDGVTFTAGPHELDGAEALLYARYRGGPDGDFGRIRRQQQVILAIVTAAGGRDLLRDINDLLPALREHTRTDLSPVELAAFAIRYRSSCTAETLHVDTLDGQVATYPDPLLNLYLSYVVVDPAEVERKVAALLGG